MMSCMLWIEHLFNNKTLKYEFLASTSFAFEVTHSAVSGSDDCDITILELLKCPLIISLSSYFAPGRQSPETAQSISEDVYYFFLN